MQFREVGPRSRVLKVRKFIITDSRGKDCMSVVGIVGVVGVHEVPGNRLIAGNSTDRISDDSVMIATLFCTILNWSDQSGTPTVAGSIVLQ